MGVAGEEAGIRAHRGPEPGGSTERAGRTAGPERRLPHWVCGLDTQPFRAWEAPAGPAPTPPGAAGGEAPVLTGTMSPCHVSRLASSTWMLRKFFIPHLRISSSSCWLTKHRGVSNGGRHCGLAPPDFLRPGRAPTPP